MKKIRITAILLLFIMACRAQNISFAALECKLNVNCDYFFIDGDQNFSYYYEFTPPNYNPKGSSALLRHDRMIKVKEKIYLRQSISFPEKKVYSVIPGKVRNNTIYMLYIAKTDDKKISVQLAEYNKDMKHNKTTTLGKVADEEELPGIGIYFSPSKQYLAIKLGSIFKLYDNNMIELNAVTVPLNVINNVSVTNKGEIIMLGLKSSQAYLSRISSSGEYKDVIINYEAGTLCDVNATADEAKNQICLVKIIGNTNAPAHNIIMNYENDVQAKKIEVLWYDISTMNEKDKIETAILPEIIKKIGMRGEYVNWLAVQTIYTSGDNTILALQKNMKKRLAINSKEESDYLVTQDLLLIRITADKKIIQNTIDRHSMIEPGAYQFTLEPVFMTVDSKTYLFCYNIKTGVGTYTFELLYGRLNNDLTFEKKSFMMDAKHKLLQIQNSIDMGNNKFLTFGHYDRGQSLSTATIDFNLP